MRVVGDSGPNGRFGRYVRAICSLPVLRNATLESDIKTHALLLVVLNLRREAEARGHHYRLYMPLTIRHRA